MDTITHGIVGALVGKAFLAGRDAAAKSPGNSSGEAQSSSVARVVVVCCTIGSTFPDIDVFAGLLAQNSLATMEWHRNLTHSLVVLPFWAALLAAISIPLANWVGWKSPPLAKLFFIYAVGIASHIFLDVITSFGTIVWSPFGYSRPAWDWVFILDLTVTALALVPQLAAWSYRNPRHFRLRAGACWVFLSLGAYGGYALAKSAGYGFPIWVAVVASAKFALILFLPSIGQIGFQWTRTKWCRVGVAFICVYLLLASAMHRRALADVQAFASRHHLPTENLGALPLPPTFTRWVGLISTPQGVWRTTFREPNNSIERTMIYTTAEPNRYIDEAKKRHDVQVYLWFARFPVWRVSQQGSQTIVDISDIRFIRDDHPTLDEDGQTSVRTRGLRPNTGFTYEIVFDENGIVVTYGFKKPPAR